MFVLAYFWSHVQQFFPTGVLIHLQLFHLVTPHSLLCPYVYCPSVLMYLLCLLDLLQSPMKLRFDVFCRFNHCLLSVLIWAKCSLFFNEWLVEENWLVTEDQTDSFLLFGSQLFVGEYDDVAYIMMCSTFLKLTLKFRVYSVDSLAACCYFASAFCYWKLEHTILSFRFFLE